MKKTSKSIPSIRHGQFRVFIFRNVLVAITLALFICSLCGVDFAEKQFAVLDGMNFFSSFSFLHLLWAFWTFAMICQIVPLSDALRRRFHISKGSQKLFKVHYAPAENVDMAAVKNEYKKSNRRAVKVLAVWLLLVGALAVIRLVLEYAFSVDHNLLDKCMFMVTVAFYASDLICGLYWCPFRAFFMKHRCCTVCRMFNWDHMMMFTPMLTVASFFSLSLLSVGIFVMLLWEYKLAKHTERFFEVSNENLKCKNCTDKRCRNRK